LLHRPAVHEQPSLPGLEPIAAWFRPENSSHLPGTLLGYSLLLVVFPELDDARRIASVVDGLCRRHGLRGEPLQAARLHVTLHQLLHFLDQVPQEHVDACVAAAGSVACHSLPLRFDRLLSFPRKIDTRHPFVLRCDARSDAGLALLRQSLAQALRRCGHRPIASGTPHMTMAYDRRVVSEHPIEPVLWTARRFNLIVSHVGRGYHQRIGEWALTSHA
jgi:2'-5' RNA ligase